MVTPISLRETDSPSTPPRAHPLLVSPLGECALEEGESNSADRQDKDHPVVVQAQRHDRHSNLQSHHSESTVPDPVVVWDAGDAIARDLKDGDAKSLVGEQRSKSQRSRSLGLRGPGGDGQ